MGKAAGFALILAGVGTAAYVVPSLDTRDRVAERRTSDVAAITVAAPQALLPAATVAPVAPRETTTVEKLAKPAVSQIETAAAPPRTSEPAKIVPLPAPQRADQKLALTKDIQRQLHRVGCYAGDIDGEWNAQTRQAMKTFVDRVNATLPIDTPDHILKTLVSGHPGDACGKACPAGQTASSGRCVPTPIQAQAPRTRLDGNRAAGELPRAPRTSENPAERPLLAAVPVPKAKAASTTEAAVSSWAPTVVVSPVPPVAVIPQPRPAPALAAAPPLASEVPAAAKLDLTGRMAIGLGTPADVAAVRPVTAEPPVAAAPVAPKTASRIVIKKRDGAVASAPPTPVIPVDTEGQAKSVPTARQQTAAVKATEPIDATAPAVVTEARKAAPKRPAMSGQAQRMPPARFVGVYISPPPVYRERFGPQIFRKMEREAR